MPNRLLHAHSPYLRQHAHNPVDWFPWGEEALEKARNENKLLLISIGYAACHWCHVMERESFENEEVAEIMNQHFVNIKIDREERPDLDKVYMDAVQIMTQQGGWPLNCIALPDGRPIYGGTYFQSYRWKQLLLKIAEMYEERPQQALEYADRLSSAIQQISLIEKQTEEIPFTKENLMVMLRNWLAQSDKEWGGQLSNGNKFPLPTALRFLLYSQHYTEQTEAGEQVFLSLDRIAQGGIYDQLGGGFARYSTDPQWKVPHFEKMLYDNAQLIGLYAEAYRKQPQPLYQKVVKESIAFVFRELTDAKGGFYSALDADTEGEEGKFYVWTEAEIRQCLQSRLADLDENKLARFLAYYEVKPMGNWEEGKNVLFVDAFEVEQDREFEQARQLLWAEREKRSRPALDDKKLTAWNALMIKGLVEAYRTFLDEAYLEAAVFHTQYLWDKHTHQAEDGTFTLYRNSQQTIKGFLDDYANLIDACIALYSVSLEEHWIAKAELLFEASHSRFYDTESGMYFYHEAQEGEFVRKFEVTDDVIPSAAAVLAHSLHKLYLLTSDNRYQNIADQMLANMLINVKKHTYWHTHWALLAMKRLFPQKEICFTGTAAHTQLRALLPQLLDDCLTGGSVHSGRLSLVADRFMTDKSPIFVCQNYSCHAPVFTVEEAQALL